MFCYALNGFIYKIHINIQKGKKKKSWYIGNVVCSMFFYVFLRKELENKENLYIYYLIDGVSFHKTLTDKNWTYNFYFHHFMFYYW